ncbi:MAG: hypothetical protein JNK85_08320 [Verrucomicrobiales bacterium]|nr:hypothetical protein [Verrucomicrobiales bacterium]
MNPTPALARRRPRLEIITVIKTFAAVVAMNGAVANAQGTVDFSTFIPDKVNARVARPSSQIPLIDGHYLGQLYAAPPNGTLAAIGKPIPFRSDGHRGYIVDGGAVEIPSVAPGQMAQVKLVAWHISLGLSYPEAVSKGQGEVGESATITLRTGTDPTSAAPLIGLQSFNIAIPIPEPGTAVVALLGGLLLFGRRRR